MKNTLYHLSRLWYEFRFRAFGKGFAELILWFCQQSLPTFKYEDFKEKTRKSKTAIQALNGWWGDLNVQFGYGLFE